METRLEFVPDTVVPDPSGLAAVLDSGEWRRHLRELAYTHWGARCVNDTQTRLLKLQMGNRCTLEIVIGTEKGWHYLIGKIYLRDRADVFEAMKKIWRAGLNREAEFWIPCPITYLPSLRLLLQEKVEGMLAKRVFLDGNPGECAEAAADGREGQSKVVGNIRSGHRQINLAAAAVRPFAPAIQHLKE